MGMSTIRFLSGDDQGYTVEVTNRNKETGRMETVQRKIPSMTVITTSTAYNLEAQFERRTHSLNIDQTKDTTRIVIGFKAELLTRNMTRHSAP